MIVKRHMRDEHSAKTDLISPPPKKQKTNEDDPVEPMDVYDQQVIDLSESLDEMEIDKLEHELIQERSKNMDNKIKEKEKLMWIRKQS